MIDFYASDVMASGVLFLRGYEYGVCYFDSRGKAKVPYWRILIKSRKEVI